MRGAAARPFELATHTERSTSSTPAAQTKGWASASATDMRLAASFCRQRATKSQSSGENAAGSSAGGGCEGDLTVVNVRLPSPTVVAEREQHMVDTTTSVCLLGGGWFLVVASFVVLRRALVNCREPGFGDVERVALLAKGSASADEENARRRDW